ncbi:MAG: ExeM/NucH family extracellular endonuclease [Gammaproteobacteria bacterium]|nr:ExeM/NucH family extracellular endonuclease [Gammaproteobacteria bacterium]
MRHYLLFLAVLLAACGSGSGGASAPAAGETPVTAIYDVQGSGASSPFKGRDVTVEGIVTGDFQYGDADRGRDLGGFYVQNAPDADPATSDGIFVFDGDKPTLDVNSGDVVRVEGTVDEFFGETQVIASSVRITGNGELLPVNISLPVSATSSNSDSVLIADLERYEGMLVRFPQTLTVSDLRELDRFGEVTLAQGGRQFQFTNRNPPDVAGFEAYRAMLAARRILLDDGSRAANEKPIRYLTAGATADYSIRVGDQITGLTGVVRFSRGSGPDGTEAYRLMPTTDPLFESTNPRPAEPELDGSFRVASFNVLNFFSGMDTGRPVCGPTGTDNCRGADSPQELNRQLEKTITALRMLNADVVGLMELENNASESIRLIVDGLNAALEAGRYAFVDTGTIGDDAIKTGFLFDTATVTLVGEAAILDSSVDARFNDARNRPAFAQTFDQISNGARLTVVVNHLKSKGSDCDDDGDPNLGDGQGNCNATRTAAATALAEWIVTDPTGSGDTDALIIGDLNAYLLEDPLSVLKNAGFTNLAEHAAGLDTYSFVFDGQSGALDHALATAGLTSQVAAVVEWHINADEPRVLDYNLEFDRDPRLFDGNEPYRASDHDPLIIGFDLIP